MLIKSITEVDSAQPCMKIKFSSLSSAFFRNLSVLLDVFCVSSLKVKEEK